MALAYLQEREYLKWNISVIAVILMICLILLERIHVSTDVSNLTLESENLNIWNIILVSPAYYIVHFHYEKCERNFSDYVFLSYTLKWTDRLIVYGNIVSCIYIFASPIEWRFVWITDKHPKISNIIKTLEQLNSYSCESKRNLLLRNMKINKWKIFDNFCSTSF